MQLLGQTQDVGLAAEPPPAEGTQCLAPSGAANLLESYRYSIRASNDHMLAAATQESDPLLLASSCSR